MKNILVSTSSSSCEYHLRVACSSAPLICARKRRANAASNVCVCVNAQCGHRLTREKTAETLLSYVCNVEIPRSIGWRRSSWTARSGFRSGLTPLVERGTFQRQSKVVGQILLRKPVQDAPEKISSRAETTCGIISHRRRLSVSKLSNIRLWSSTGGL